MHAIPEVLLSFRDWLRTDQLHEISVRVAHDGELRPVLAGTRKRNRSLGEGHDSRRREALERGLQARGADRDVTEAEL